MNKFFFVFFLLMVGCYDLLPPPDPQLIPNNLNIYDVWKQLTDLEEDENGYFHFSYQATGTSDSDYGTVKYMTSEPLTRVFWTSPDEFCVDHFGTEICESIICCSTYSGDDGYGQQLFYIYEDHIGDTLTVYGSISDSYVGDLIDSVFIIIED